MSSSINISNVSFYNGKDEVGSIAAEENGIRITGLLGGGLGAENTTVPNGINSGDYLVWNATTDSWDVGGAAVMIGQGAGTSNQGNDGVAIGYTAGNNNQGNRSVAIGSECASTSQGECSVAIGYQAGATEQGNNAVAIGYQAATTSGEDAAVAIGAFAGYSNQKYGAIAIGINSGRTNQGFASIALGVSAGYSNQHDNTVIISALNSNVNSVAPSSLYVAPVRELTSSVDPGSTGCMMYNANTYEMYFNTSKTFVINHPDEESKYLVHACLEGPEVGVYYRGKSEIFDNKVTVHLPEYTKHFSEFTVHLTSIYDKETDTYPQNLRYALNEDNSFDVYGTPGKFSWIVHAARGKIDVEPSKEDYTLCGDGPYTYLNKKD